MNLLHSVARFDADSDRSNLNCNRNPQNSKSKKDETSSAGITQVNPNSKMKTYKNLYPKIYSKKNLILAFKKARKGKTTKYYVVEFEINLDNEINKLHTGLKNLTYKPNKLKKFIIRDPKTRTIHSSKFIDRVVHHAIVNILEPIYEKIFIYDSYASRKNKGIHKAIKKYDKFKRKVSKNLNLIKDPYNKNNIMGYVLKSDIKKYFGTVNHKVLLQILKRKIKDKNTIWLIKQIFKNFNTKIEGKGMPLGNLTSQFFANVYLNELDYFVKHKLRAKYYIRYVDDFVILHEDRYVLLKYKEKISKYLKNLDLELHKDKTKIRHLRDGVTLLGYRNYGRYKLLRKNNLKRFQKEFNKKLTLIMNRNISIEELSISLTGWFGYAKWANTYKLRKRILEKLNKKFNKNPIH